MKHKQTKISVRIYRQWLNTPSGLLRSFVTVGWPQKRWTGEPSEIGKKFMRSRFDEPDSGGKWLVLVTSNEYENALVGNAKEVKTFVKDCLDDLKQ